MWAEQEQWAWDMRSEQSVIDIFSKIWGTDELLVSIGGSTWNSRRRKS